VIYSVFLIVKRYGGRQVKPSAEVALGEFTGNGHGRRQVDYNYTALNDGVIAAYRIVQADG